MKIIPLYRYERPDGGVTVSPDKPETEYTELFRIVADEGKAVTKDGTDLRAVVDTGTANGWYEVDMPEEEPETAVLESTVPPDRIFGD